MGKKHIPVDTGRKPEPPAGEAGRLPGPEASPGCWHSITVSSFQPQDPLDNPALERSFQELVRYYRHSSVGGRCLGIVHRMNTPLQVLSFQLDLLDQKAQEELGLLTESLPANTDRLVTLNHYRQAKFSQLRLELNRLQDMSRSLVLQGSHEDAQEKFRRARDPQEKLECLRDMLRTIPKHKGTEHLQAEIKSRVKELVDELGGPRKGAARGGPDLTVRHEGAAQVALVGPPNAGKSSLHARLTGSHAVVGPYPFSTKHPLPGMLLHEDVQLQLVDLPPVAADYFEPWMSGTLQGTDAVASMVRFRDGRPERSGYRRYRIRGHAAADDPGMIHEAVARRVESRLEQVGTLRAGSNTPGKVSATVTPLAESGPAFDATIV